MFSSLRYHRIWHPLQRQRKGWQVLRSAVEEIVRELDPERVKERKAHRLCRRECIYSGPNIRFGIQMGTIK